VTKQKRTLVKDNKHFGGCTEKYYTFESEEIEDANMSKAYEVEDRIYKKGDMFFVQRIQTKDGVKEGKYLLQKFVKSSDSSFVT
jgi:hypothetical protein